MALHPVCSKEEIPVNEKKAVKVNGEKVLVFHLEDGFYATQNRCTHLVAPLGKGKIVDGDKIQCPFHRARFDIRTGAVVDWANFPPGIQLLNVIRGEKSLKTYKVTVDAGKLMLEM
ncbi:MAG: Rieske (2Fe-2S) protein [Nitrospiria bacterium]